MKKILLAAILLSSCVYDRTYEIANFDNQSEIDLVVTYGSNQMNDNSLFYGTKYSIKKRSSFKIMGQLFSDKNSNITFGLYNHDTVYNRIKLGLIKGIVESSFIKKIVIKSNGLKANNKIIYP